VTPPAWWSQARAAAGTPRLRDAAADYSAPGLRPGWLSPASAPRWAQRSCGSG
jgi:hypothetical protein